MIERAPSPAWGRATDAPRDTWGGAHSLTPHSNGDPIAQSSTHYKKGRRKRGDQRDDGWPEALTSPAPRR